MSNRLRSVLGAFAFCGGLLFVVGGSIYKSSDRIRYERDLERHKPNPELPQTAGGNVFMALGALLAAGGTGALAFSLRDMARQIGEAQSRAEASMRMEVSAKREAKPKT